MIKNRFAQVSAQDWKKCCGHVMDIEEKYWESGIAKDGEMDKVEFLSARKTKTQTQPAVRMIFPTQTPILRTTDCTCIILHL